jgi:hypothetical protein
VATEHSFNFLSEAEHIRITESVKKIEQMQAAEGAAVHPVGRTLALLPSASEYGPRVSVPPGEDAKNAPAKPKLRTPVIGNCSACRYGIVKRQCPTCAQLGEY